MRHLTFVAGKRSKNNYFINGKVQDIPSVAKNALARMQT